MSIKKAIRVGLSVISILMVLVVTFYFWASSSNYPEQAYIQLIHNSYPESNDGDSIHRIVTYNIGYLSGMTNNLPIANSKSLFDDNLDLVYSEFEKLNPDMICFQEIDYASDRSYGINQQEALQKLGFNFVFQSINWDVNYVPFPYFPLSVHFGQVLSGQSILSKYPIHDIESIVLERPKNMAFYYDRFYIDRLAQVSKITIEHKTVVLINVHLEAFNKTTRQNQTKYIVTLYKQYKDDYPVLLVGDFNSDPDFEKASIQMILDIAGIGSASLEAGNYDNSFPSNEPSSRLDYIFYNKKFIEIKHAKILTSFGQASDHLPLMMDFKLK